MEVNFKIPQRLGALACFLVLSILVSSEARVPFSRAGLGRPSHGYLYPPAKPEGVSLPPEEWFTQKLDHFSDSETGTWSQRYYTNDKYYKEGGPVFLMIGGEGPADAIWMVEGAWTTYAEKLNALMFQVEHRYYGKSQPTKDASVDNLQYLSSEQALADLADFTVALQKKLNLTDNKWIAFGGSYSGSLAAWYRLKYPDLVHGAVATSAPLLAQVDFKEYLEVVHTSLVSESGKSCSRAIQDATDEIALLLSRQTGWQVLSSMFRLCTDLDGKAEEDVANLHELLAETVDYAVQYNKDNRAFEGATDANFTIDTVCDIMTNESIESAVDRYAAVNNLLMDLNGEKCFEHRYSVMIDALKGTDWSEGAIGGRSWIYQTCTEFGWYQDSDSLEQPFGHKFPLKFFTQMCQDIYGESFDVKFLEKAVAKTNAIYGGLKPNVTRVVFPNGSVDPWHALGITANLTSDASAIYIEGTAHCANMYPPREEDLSQLVEAREQILDFIQEWLSEE